MISDTTGKLTDTDYKNAFSEVAFLVENFAKTIDTVMGGATAPVGRFAGRDMARKLPLHLEDRSIGNVMGILAKRMHAGFEISLTATIADASTVTFGRCAIRQNAPRCGTDRN